MIAYVTKDSKQLVALAENRQPYDTKTVTEHDLGSVQLLPYKEGFRNKNSWDTVNNKLIQVYEEIEGYKPPPVVSTKPTIQELTEETLLETKYQTALLEMLA